MSAARYLYLLFALLWAALPARAEPLLWEPSRTRVLVVGVLEWQDASLFSPFTAKDRRDAALVELFRQRGAEVTYLQDRSATLAGVRSALGSILAESRPGELLVVYYCGHGTKDGRGDTLFAVWDAGERPGSYLSAAWLVAEVARGFHGDGVWYLADCCCSGGIADALEARPGGPAAAAITSSSANESSTGNWTFTQGVLDGLQGNPLLDADRDGQVRLGEVAGYLADDMALYHGQLSSFFAAGVDPRAVVSPTSGEPAAGAGRRVEGWDQGTWWPARVVEEKDGKVRVRWLTIGYDTAESDSWLEPDRVRSVTLTRHTVGARVEVEWHGQWYPAVILEERRGVHHVHYEGYSDEWDEWVPPQRVRAPE